MLYTLVQSLKKEKRNVVFLSDWAHTGWTKDTVGPCSWMSCFVGLSWHSCWEPARKAAAQLVAARSSSLLNELSGKIRAFHQLPGCRYWEYLRQTRFSRREHNHCLLFQCSVLFFPPSFCCAPVFCFHFLPKCQRTVSAPFNPRPEETFAFSSFKVTFKNKKSIKGETENSLCMDFSLNKI